MVTTPGTASVTITAQPQPTPLTFTITAAPLVLSSILPTSVVAGSFGFTLAVSGSGFTSATGVTWNGAALSTNFTNSTTLNASVPANLVATAGTASVGVTAPGQTSPAPLTFTVTAAPPALTSISPNTAIAGSAALTLAANGSGFSNGAIVTWNGSPLG